MPKYDILEVMKEIRTKTREAEQKITEFASNTVADLKKETGVYVENVKNYNVRCN